jgi:anti-sigma regulatory factor (Ser/Thr protein kinase)
VAETRAFRFSSRPEAVSAARRALHGFDSHLDAGAFYDASLCVSELVTNAVLHAGIGPDDELELEVTIEDSGLLRVAVSDTGSGFEPPAPSVDGTGGWGLFIVDRLSERWGVERRGGTRVWFEIGRGGARASTDERASEEQAADVRAGRPARAEGARGRSMQRLRLRTEQTA